MLNLRNYSACSIKYSYSSIQIKVSCPIFVGKTEIHRCLPFSTFRIKRIAAFFQKTNIVKGESRDKGEMEFSRMNYAEPPPIFYKYSKNVECTDLYRRDNCFVRNSFGYKGFFRQGRKISQFAY